jgi:hypothetical protein
MVGGVMPAFDADLWELYDGSTDYSQAHNLATDNPEMLATLQRLWLIEATKYNVLPMDDRALERAIPELAGRPTLIRGDSQLFFPGMGRLSENSVVSIKNKSFSVTAEVEYRVNAMGLRGPETPVEKPAGRRRVAVLGDSIAFGYWVAEKDAFPHQLEELLNEVKGAEPSFEALNFGVPGYNLDQEIEVLRAKALATAPDLVVIAFCLNDLEGLFSYEYGLTVDRAARGNTITWKWW